MYPAEAKVVARCSGRCPLVLAILAACAILAALQRCRWLAHEAGQEAFIQDSTGLMWPTDRGEATVVEDPSIFRAHWALATFTVTDEVASNIVRKWGLEQAKTPFGSLHCNTDELSKEQRPVSSVSGSDWRLTAGKTPSGLPWWAELEARSGRVWICVVFPD